MAKGSIIVLDEKGTVLESTAGGKARKLLRNQQAEIHSREPFAIRLSETVEQPSRSTKVGIVNFTKYFEKERDVYIQNISGEQVSLTFSFDGGRTESYLVPPSKEPFNLSAKIPYQAIKNSMDLRKMLNRRPPALQLLEEGQFIAFYEGAARKAGLKTKEGKPDVEAAIEAAELLHNRLKDKTLVLDTAPEPEKIHDVIEDDPFGKKSVRSRSEMSEDELINPKILFLCQQVATALEDKAKMPAANLLDELKVLPNLTVDDLEYVRSHGWYKSVKNWAKAELAEKTSNGESVSAGAEA